jgi:hypothetical protein
MKEISGKKENQFSSYVLTSIHILLLYEKHPEIPSTKPKHILLVETKYLNKPSLYSRRAIFLSHSNKMFLKKDTLAALPVSVS